MNDVSEKEIKYFMKTMYRRIKDELIFKKQQLKELNKIEKNALKSSSQKTAKLIKQLSKRKRLSLMYLDLMRKRIKRMS